MPVRPVWTTAELTRHQNVGEENFAVAWPCIVDRLALNIVAGTAIYTLPDYIINIRRASWRGWKLWPLPHRDLRQTYLSGTQSGRSYWYIFNNIGQNQIQLFPVPSENISAVSTNLYGAEILNRVILEFYRAPDFTTFKIPRYLRRRLLRSYAMKRSFEMEKRGLNIKAGKYHTEKWKQLFDLYGNTYDDLISKPRNIVCSTKNSNPYGITPPPPLLPIDKFGVSVDEMY